MAKGKGKGRGKGRPPLELAAFRAEAEAVWAAIPAHFRDGAILLVHPEAEPDPEYESVFFLGACESAFAPLEDALAASGDYRQGDRQSVLHVWFGSFVAMRDQSLDFDWPYELEETILHELTHHWEHRAGLDGLDRFDAAQLTNFQRLRGLAVPMYFWRDGEPWPDGRWHIDGDVFVEVDGPPPWTVRAEDGQAVEAEPDPLDGWATLLERGALFDGRRGDLVVAPRPPERPGLGRRIWRLVRRWLPGRPSDESESERGPESPGEAE